MSRNAETKAKNGRETEGVGEEKEGSSLIRKLDGER